LENNSVAQARRGRGNLHNVSATARWTSRNQSPASPAAAILTFPELESVEPPRGFGRD
jgi:hypothetical protein